jgi:hypothetical protein
MDLNLIASKIYDVRGQKVMLDADLAELYGIATKVLNQAVRRNKDRFPEDFMFSISDSEYSNLKSQNVTSSWGGKRKPATVFTEHGVTMLASVLRSESAIKMNIAIVRTFIAMRQAIIGISIQLDDLYEEMLKGLKWFKMLKR